MKQETIKKEQAFVIFSGKTEIRWLRILKPGFRHCFVLLNDGRHWISLDPLSNYTDILVHHLPPDFDFPHWLAKRGHAVVPARVQRRMKPAPCGLFTCVEAVKRVIGLHARFVFTPWQLYRHLKNHQNKGDFSWEV